MLRLLLLLSLYPAFTFAQGPIPDLGQGWVEDPEAVQQLIQYLLQ